MKYYVYRQESIFLNVYTNYSLYKWSSFTLIAKIEGTRNLYNYIGPIGWYKKRLFTNSLSDYGYTFRVYKTFNNAFTDYSYRYLIIDEKGNVRDFNELTDRYKKKRHRNRNTQAYQYHHPHLSKHKRKALSNVELKEIKYKYGFNLYDKNMNDTDKYYYYDSEIGHKKPKNWKSQSKRLKQFKTSAIYYNNQKHLNYAEENGEYYYG